MFSGEPHTFDGVRPLVVLSASLDATLSLSGAKLLRARKGDLSADAGVEGDEGVAGPGVFEVEPVVALPFTRTVGDG